MRDALDAVRLNPASSAVSAALERTLDFTDRLVDDASNALDALVRRRTGDEDDGERVRGGYAMCARAVELALEEYDVRHAHLDARARIALRLSGTLERTIRAQEQRWVALDAELAEVSGMVTKVWEQSASLEGTFALMSEVEEMLLEAEIALELDALYKRRDDAEAKDAEAERAFEQEVAHVMQLHDLLQSDAMTNAVSSRTTEEIMAEQELKKKLASMAKKRAKESGVDESLKDIASSIDVASTMSTSMPNDLDDFFTDDPDESEATSSAKAYTLYGLRARAEMTKGTIMNQPHELKMEKSIDVDEAERIALARKEALGIADEDMRGVNLRPPPPKGGAQDGPLEDAQSPRRIVIESKSVTDQVSDKLKNFSIGGIWESASASTTAAVERVSAATAAAAAASSDAMKALQERTATMKKTVEKRSVVEEAPKGYYKKDAGTST